MSVIEVNIPRVKWSLLEWKNPNNEKPKENDRVLVNVGDDVVATRFTHGAFYQNNWTRTEKIVGWALWPKPPIG